MIDQKTRQLCEAALGRPMDLEEWHHARKAIRKLRDLDKLPEEIALAKVIEKLKEHANTLDR